MKKPKFKIATFTVRMVLDEREDDPIGARRIELMGLSGVKSVAFEEWITLNENAFDDELFIEEENGKVL